MANVIILHHEIISKRLVGKGICRESGPKNLGKIGLFLKKYNIFCKNLPLFGLFCCLNLVRECI